MLFIFILLRTCTVIVVEDTCTTVMHVFLPKSFNEKTLPSNMLRTLAIYKYVVAVKTFTLFDDKLAS